MSWSTPGAPSRPSGATCGWASTSAPTSRCRNTIAREIVVNDLQHHTFIEHATLGLLASTSIRSWTGPWNAASRSRACRRDVIREVAHAYAKADRAMICWTLGITEHHNAVDNVLSLINLSLLTGHVGMYGSGVNPLRGQNNVQGGGDMGAIPNKLPGFQDIETGRRGAREVRSGLGRADHPEVRLHPDPDVRGDGARGAHGRLRDRREPRQQRGRQDNTPRNCSAASTRLIVQDLFMTRTAELADVVFPASNASFESDGTVTNSERRVQRVRKALDPPGERARRHLDHRRARRRMGAGWGEVTAARCVGGAPNPEPDARRDELAAPRGAGRPPVAVPGRRAPGHAVPARPSVGATTPPTRERRRRSRSSSTNLRWTSCSEEFPLRLTTGRRLDSYNTGVQTGALHLAASTRRDDRCLARGRRADGAWPRTNA